MITPAEQKTINKAIAILSREAQSGSFVRDASTVKRLAQLELGAEERERFGVFFLTSQNQVISFEILFSGTIDCSAVYPREVVKAALLHNAASVILTHNHPSGSLTQSDSDVKITTRLTNALSMIDVRVLDHIIVTAAGALSFAEKGLL